MKKIFAVLISLLFVASVFGVASILGAIIPCSSTALSSSTVRVGDTFTFTVGSEGTPDVKVTGTGAVVLVSGPTKIGEDHQWVTTYRAISPGDVKLVVNNYCESHVQIISRDLPFKFFAKLFKFGKKK